MDFHRTKLGRSDWTGDAFSHAPRGRSLHSRKAREGLPVLPWCCVTRRQVGIGLVVRRQATDGGGGATVALRQHLPVISPLPAGPLQTASQRRSRRLPLPSAVSDLVLHAMASYCVRRPIAMRGGFANRRCGFYVRAARASPTHLPPFRGRVRMEVGRELMVVIPSRRWWRGL